MINLNELDEQSKSFFDLLNNNNNNNNNRRLTFEEITISNTSKDPFEGIRTNKTADKFLTKSLWNRLLVKEVLFIKQNL